MDRKKPAGQGQGKEMHRSRISSPGPESRTEGSGLSGENAGRGSKERLPPLPAPPFSWGSSKSERSPDARPNAVSQGGKKKKQHCRRSASDTPMFQMDFSVSGSSADGAWLLRFVRFCMTDLFWVKSGRGGRGRKGPYGQSAPARWGLGHAAAVDLLRPSGAASASTSIAKPIKSANTVESPISPTLHFKFPKVTAMVYVATGWQVVPPAYHHHQRMQQRRTGNVFNSGQIMHLYVSLSSTTPPHK